MTTATLTSDLQDAVPLSRSRGLFPGNPSVQTIKRYSKIGVDGIKLRVWRIGSRYATTPAAVEEFLTALNSGSAEGSADA